MTTEETIVLNAVYQAKYKCWINHEHDAPEGYDNFYVATEKQPDLSIVRHLLDKRGYYVFITPSDHECLEVLKYDLAGLYYATRGLIAEKVV